MRDSPVEVHYSSFMVAVVTARAVDGGYISDSRSEDSSTAAALIRCSCSRFYGLFDPVAITITLLYDHPNV